MNRRASLVLIFLSLLLYANTVPNQYALDDGIVITKNKFTQQGFAGIPSILSTDTFVGFLGEDRGLVTGGRYRPLSLVTFAIEHDIVGDNPHVSHAVNVLLFALSVVVLFRVLRRLMPRSGSTWWLAAPFVAAALFAAHPIHTEAVANIKGRDEVMALLFALLSLELLFRYTESRNIMLLIAAPAVFLLALLSKENAITFAVVVPLALYAAGEKRWRYLVLSTIPFALSAIIFLAVRYIVAGGGATGEITEILNNAYARATLAEKYATISYTLGRYLMLLVFPHPLTHDYYFNQIPYIGWNDARAIVPVMVYAAMIAVAVWSWQRQRLITFSILYFLVTLSIVSNIVFPIGTTMSERFLYMPSIGFCIVLAMVVARVGTFAAKNFRMSASIVSAGLFLLVLAGYSTKTLARNPVWKDNLTLFSTDVQTSPNSAKLQNALGEVLVTLAYQETDSLKQWRMLNDAEPHLLRAIEIYPTFDEPHFSLGNVYFRRDRNYPKAIAYYEKAVALSPGFPGASGNLALTHYRYGRLLADQGKVVEAMAEYETALRYNSSMAEAHYHLGYNLAQQGKTPDAIHHYLEAIRLEPASPDPHNDLGIVYARQGNTVEAANQFREALRLDPSSANAHLNLGLILEQQGKSSEAVAHFTEALKVKPDLVVAQAALARATSRRNR
jgi:Tfp pilus assembly protein PilF